jgi:hypothetical protein
MLRYDIRDHARSLRSKGARHRPNRTALAVNKSIGAKQEFRCIEQLDAKCTLGPLRKDRMWNRSFEMGRRIADDDGRSSP